MLTTILLFIGILVIVVIGHEFGHFIVARWNGVKVEEFGFGLPPKIWGFKPKNSETEYNINALPLGGYVKLLGEEGDNRDNLRSFASKKPWQRIAILSAGVIMNIIIAVIAFTIVGMLGSQVGIDDSEINSDKYTNITTLIATVAKDSPAEKADLRFGDEIQSIAGIKVITQDEVSNIIKDNIGQSIDIVIKRGEQTLTKTLEPRENPPEGQGAIGISTQLTGMQKFSLFESFKLSFIRIYVIISTTLYILGQMIMSLFTQAPLPAEADVTGPVGLVRVVGDIRDLGLTYIITFVGLISTSLALFNILPIPALDGGRIVFVIIEWIKGSPVSQALENKFHVAGYSILMLLTLLVTVRDIIKLF
jgi:regulator of sigma E protease